jgi:PAS domain S-box-containing protein
MHWDACPAGKPPAGTNDMQRAASQIPFRHLPTDVASPHELIEQALHGSGIGLWDWDLVTGQAHYSSLNTELLGYAEGELGDTFEQQAAKIHPDDARAMQERVAAHLRNETPVYRAEFRVLRKDGTYAWFESRGLVVERSPAGEPLRMIGTHLDISDRKANEQLRRDLEAALRRNQDDLEAMVRQQTRRLEDAVDTAEMGNRAKNVFLAKMSEQLQTPLDVVARVTAGLCAGAFGVVPDHLREPLTQIQQSSRQLSEVVTRLLDVRSIETDSLEVFPTQVNLRHVLEEQCEQMALQAQQKGVDLRVVICDETLVVFADRARLAQVVRELLSNAIRFTEHGWIQVRTKTYEGTALIEVQDTGVGIPPERQPTLFQAFQSIADQPPSLRRGLGLGLPIARAIVDAMAGTIGVSSKVGRGSRFWFTVPLATSAQTISSTLH